MTLCFFAGRVVKADPAAESVTVTAAPIGRFGFGTGSGGVLWNPTIGHLVVNQIQAGGPAEKAGLRLGDEILSVDGLTVPGRSRSEVFPDNAQQGRRKTGGVQGRFG